MIKIIDLIGKEIKVHSVNNDEEYLEPNEAYFIHIIFNKKLYKIHSTGRNPIIIEPVE